MTSAPFVSIVIPCRNEVRYIGACLDSLIANHYPKERVEILVVDGMSEDGTRAVVREYAVGNAGIRLLDNPKQVTPAALNIGIRAARGDFIMRVDAHLVCPPHYLPRSIAALNESGADNVGGVLVTLPTDQTAVSRAIAAAMSHRFGVGNSYFRTGITKPRWVDTVPFGCYRRDVFSRVGLFDEELLRNQDDEFNLRLLKGGGRLLLIPDVVSAYYARASLEKLWRMFFQYGYFKPLVVRKVGGVMTARQLAPAVLVGTIVSAALLVPWLDAGRWLFGATVGGYLAADLVVSAFLARRLGVRVGLAAIAAFPVLHFAYGLGYLLGVFDFLIRGKRPAAAVSLSR